MPYLFSAVSEIERNMTDHRITSVFVPLMGSGHGGLKKEAALFGLLLAVCNAAMKPYGHHIAEFNIVIFQASEKEKPSIQKSTCKRLLRIATGMYESIPLILKLRYIRPLA